MKYKLKEDFVIPVGTEFECIDGVKVEYVNGNYKALIGTGKDSTADFVINSDTIEANKDLFEEV